MICLQVNRLQILHDFLLLFRQLAHPFILHAHQLVRVLADPPQYHPFCQQFYHHVTPHHFLAITQQFHPYCLLLYSHRSFLLARHLFKAVLHPHVNQAVLQPIFHLFSHGCFQQLYQRVCLLEFLQIVPLRFHHCFLHSNHNVLPHLFLLHCQPFFHLISRH